MAKTWSQRARAQSRAQHRQARPFSQSGHQETVRDSRWMIWLAVGILLVILWFTVVRLSHRHLPDVKRAHEMTENRESGSQVT